MQHVSLRCMDTQWLHQVGREIWFKFLASNVASKTKEILHHTSIAEIHRRAVIVDLQTFMQNWKHWVNLQSHKNEQKLINEWHRHPTDIVMLVESLVTPICHRLCFRQQEAVNNSSKWNLFFKCILLLTMYYYSVSRGIILILSSIDCAFGSRKL